MSDNKHYSNEPLGEVEVIVDFLPPAESLRLREKPHEPEKKGGAVRESRRPAPHTQS